MNPLDKAKRPKEELKNNQEEIRNISSFYICGNTLKGK